MNQSDDLILRLENIGYVAAPGKRLLENITFELKKGERFVIVGPSGAGKTTLLRIIQRLQEPCEGSLFLHEKDYKDIPPLALRRRIAFVFQEPALFEGTVETNLRIHEWLGFQHTPFSGEELEQALTSCGLPQDFLQRNTLNLSTGEVKRVAVARALLGKPEVLLLDEPTANLDPTASVELIQTLKNLTKNGLSLLAVTHHVDHAHRLATRAMLIVEGAIIETAESSVFFNSPQRELTRRFLSGELK